MQRLRNIRAAWKRIPSWKVWATSTTLLTVSGVASSVYFQSQKRRQWEESREFPPNSATEQIFNALDTGDIIIFNRRVWDGRPLRSLYVLLSKYVGGEYDHVGVIIKNREHDIPYLLEYNLLGLQLLPFDTRVLHSSSHEIILRHVDCPRTADHYDRVEAVLSYLQHSLSPSSPLKHLGRLAVAGMRRGAGGGVEGQHVKEMGEYAQLVQEIERTKQRVAALDDEQQGEGEDEVKKRLQGKRYRLSSSLQRLTRREMELRRGLKNRIAASSPSSSQPSVSSPAALIQQSPSPSTALVVVVLQALSALSLSSADQAVFDAAAENAADSAAATVECARFPSIPPSPVLTFPYPPVSFYQSRHFLSQTQLPLSPDSVLERELFVKTSGKTLQYSVIN